MFHFTQSLFEFSENLQESKPQFNELPTTHNSPGSFKTKSIQLEDSPFNCSFDEGCQAGHATSVWDASVKYLTSALEAFVDTAKGFNDEDDEDLQKDSLSVEDLIFQNNNLKIQQKHEFVSDLQNETELMGLLRELLSLFSVNIFQEITYVIYKIWEKKTQSKNQAQTQKVQEEPLIPHFDCFHGFEDEEVTNDSFDNLFATKTMEEVVEEADRCAEQICHDIYFDNKVEILNLKTVNAEVKKDADTPALFSDFFKTMARSVFLSAEGFFSQPAENPICEEFSNELDFDFQMNAVSALQEFEQNKNPFVRSFSQDLQDDDEEFDFVSAPTKRRKMQ